MTPEMTKEETMVIEESILTWSLCARMLMRLLRGPRLVKEPIQPVGAAAFFSWSIIGPSGEPLNEGAILKARSISEATHTHTHTGPHKHHALFGAEG